VSKGVLPAARSLLVRALLDVRGAIDLSASEWDLLVRQARRADLLATLAVRLAESGLLQRVPEAPRAHLESARRVAGKQSLDVYHEVRCIVRALSPMWIPVVLLKGAAYVRTGSSAAAGRMLGDIDILVPRTVIDEVERHLDDAGWVGFKSDPYDQRYFRVWMHEIPPLVHDERGVTLDVHHTILPPTARLKPDAAKLLAAARTVDTDGVVHVLGDLDMVLHSATHLFHEGEFEHGLRDLLDLDRLLREAAERDAGFWPALLRRAVEMDLTAPLAYALRYAHAVWETPVPVTVLRRSGEQAGLGTARLALMDFLYGRALAAPHPSCDVAGSRLARWCLYVRSHWLKMPIRLLLPHLVRKAFRRHLYEE